MSDSSVLARGRQAALTVALECIDLVNGSGGAISPRLGFARLAAESRVSSAGKFEVLAITAGNGNGWEFGADVLRASLPLWDGRECFVDHSLDKRSVRDLGGIFHSPLWDESAQGVQLQLETLGPAGREVDELGRQVLSGKAQRVGFSADLVFNVDVKKVIKIVRINSVDLVLSPARGGAFVRALNSTHGRGVSLEGSMNLAVACMDAVMEVTDRESHRYQTIALARDLMVERLKGRA